MPGNSRRPFFIAAFGKLQNISIVDGDVGNDTRSKLVLKEVEHELPLTKFVRRDGGQAEYISPHLGDDVTIADAVY